MPKLNINFKGLFHICKVYEINEKGLDFCPAEETYVEKLSDCNDPLFHILRFMRTGSRSDVEIYGKFSDSYRTDRIRNALTTVEYLGLADVRRQLTR